MSARIAFLDVETTGLDPFTHEVVEIAILRDDETFHSFVRPEHPERALPWCRDNIGWKMDAPSWAEVEPEVRRMLEGVDYLVAHNASFDVGMIQGMAHRAGGSADWLPKYKLDTVALAWTRFGDSLGSLSLANVACALGIDQQAAHTALDDANVLQRVFSRLQVGNAHRPERAAGLQ